MSLSWGCCPVGDNGESHVTCAKCKKKYHRTCLSIDDAEALGVSWHCPGCLSTSKNRIKNDSTPVRTNPNVTLRPNNKQVQNHSEGSQGSSSDGQLSPSLVRDIVQDIVATEISGLINKITESVMEVFQKELKSVKEEMKEIKESMDFMGNKFDEISAEQIIAKETVKNIEVENLKLKSTIQDLNVRINNMEQHARSNNMEIQCVPENRNENLSNVVINLAKVVDCALDETKILNFTRISKVNRNNNRPRSIIVQLATPRLRDSLLAACIKFNKAHPDDKLNTAHLGYSGDKSPIFVCEHLSSTNKALHAAARLKAKEMGYKFVWVKNGKVFMKKNENSESKYIKDLSSLENLM